MNSLATNFLAMRIAQLPWGFINLLGKNSRWPKKANHGARPCSHIMRRLRTKGSYRKPKKVEGGGG